MKSKVSSWFHEGEASHGGTHRHVLAGLGGNFLRQHLFQEVGVGRVLGGGLLQQGFQPLPTLEQTQFSEVLAEAFELGRIHAASSIRSYTARSRTSTSCANGAGWATAVSGLATCWRAFRATAPGPCSG